MEDVLVSPGGQLSGFAKACPCLCSLGVKIKLKKKKTKQNNNYSLNNTSLHAKILKIKTSVCLPSFIHYDENPFGTCIKIRHNFVSLTSHTPRAGTT